MALGGTRFKLGRFSARQQCLDFGLQLRLNLPGMAIGPGAVPRSVGVQLGAIQGDGAEQQPLDLPGKAQDLHQQSLELRHTALAKRAPGVVVGMRIGGNITKRQRLIGRLLDAAAAKGAAGIAVDQQAVRRLIKLIKEPSCGT